MTAPAVRAPYFDGTQPCRYTDPEVFFPTSGDCYKQIKTAKAICEQCPFRRPCLEYALTSYSKQGYESGIWGGTTEWERSRMRAARRRSAA